MARRKAPDTKSKRGNPDLAEWHGRIQAERKRGGGTTEEAAARTKAAEMRHYRKAKTPGTGN